MSKTLNTVEYIDSLLELTRQGMEVSLIIAGGSMLPFLAGGRDTVSIKQPDRPMKRGDIVLFRRQNGQYVLHRLHHRNASGWYIIGDAQVQLEGPVPESDICAIVTGAMRKGTSVTPSQAIWKFFERVWIRIIPLRKFLEKAYITLKSTDK